MASSDLKPVGVEDVAICVIHGNSPDYTGEFAERCAWPRIQMQRLRRHTPAGFRVFAFANQAIAEHEEYLSKQPEVTLFRSHQILSSEHTHVWPLRNWLAARAVRERRIVVHLDSDAFPVRDDWLPRYLKGLRAACPVVAVRRDENGDRHSDRCFLMYHRRDDRVHRFDFSKVGFVDAGAGIGAGLEEKGLAWRPLLRTNRHDYHPLISAIYDDRIYHHGAGSRLPRFRMNQELDDEVAWDRERATHRMLMSRLFENSDRFLAELRGEAEAFDLAAALSALSPEGRENLGVSDSPA